MKIPLQNKTCSGFVACYHPNDEDDLTTTSPQYVHRKLLENWDLSSLDQYTIIEEASGIPILNNGGRFELNWNNNNISDNNSITHYSFWAVRNLHNKFATSGYKAYVDVLEQYVITTQYNNIVFCLNYSPITKLISWLSLEENILGKEFEKTIVWNLKFANKNNKKGFVKEGDDVLLFSATNSSLVLSKVPDSCDVQNNPLFTLQSVDNISVISNRFHGRGIHEESTPVCKFTDCENDCTLIHFQILGSNLSINNKTTLLSLKQQTDTANDGTKLNTTDNLAIALQSVGLFLLALILLLFLVLAYYKFIPKEFDYISRVTVDDVYYNVKDLISL